jgi:BolA family transcriptional regulator, general stress-responsive regulator
MNSESPRVQLIRERLTAAFSPCESDIVDEGHLHAGHAGAAGGAGHFRVRLVSEHFRGLRQIERHRQVYAVLADMIPAQIHALAIDARAPGEPPG